MPPDAEEPRLWGIGDLNRRASLAVVRDFRGQIWCVGELTKLDDRRGHRYLQLLERGGGRDGRDAHLDAFCSATKWQRLERRLAAAGVELRAGQRLKVQGCLDIGDRGRLTLTVDDLDVDALVGERVRSRQMLVQRLIDDGLFDANRRLPLPALPLRIGLVASAGSDGHRDVVRQLEGSGFAFAVTLRSVPVEGPAAPRAIQAALATFGPDDVDVAVIVRGGGAKASLDVFDTPVVAHAIATSTVPVWTGIGHTGDRAVADEVAHRAFPTPSALGQGLAAAVAAAHDDVARLVARIGGQVDARLATATAQLDSRWGSVTTRARSQLALHEQASARAAGDLRRSAGHGLDLRAGQLAAAVFSIRASGGVELRDAQRRLAGLALDTAGAAGRRCVDARRELVAGAAAATAAAGDVLDRAVLPVRAAGVALRRPRFDRVLDQQSTAVAASARELGRDLRRRLAADAGRAEVLRAVLAAYDPGRQLARGWTLTHTADGRLVRSAQAVTTGDALVTTFADGTAASTVTGVTHDDQEGPPHE